MTFSLRSLLLLTALAAVALAVSTADWISCTLILTTASTVYAVDGRARSGRKNLVITGASVATCVFWVASLSVVLADVKKPRPADPRSDYFIMQSGYLPTLFVFFVVASVIICFLGGLVGFAWQRVYFRDTKL